jgi:hypothetical protein
MTTRDDFYRFICTIWESTLGLNIRPIPWPGRSEQEACTLIGKVQITGAWLGTVLLECSEKLAKKAARIMFGLDSEELTSEEVRDALAEITNVTAGNFKSLVYGHCCLSIPQVTDRGLERRIEPSIAVNSRQAFDCEGELLLVTVLSQDVENPFGLSFRNAAGDAESPLFPERDSSLSLRSGPG